MSEHNYNSNKLIAKNTILLSIRMVFVLFLSLYTTRITLNVLGVQDYGIYNVVAGFVSMFVFLNTSMSNGIQRFYNYELSRNGIIGARHVYVTSLLIQLLLIFIVLLLSETLGLWYLHSKMVIPPDRFLAAKIVFHVSIFSFVFVIMQVPFYAAIMAHEHMKFYAFLGVLDAVLKLTIVLLIPYLNCDLLILYSVFILAVNILNFILSFIYAKKHFEELTIIKFFNKRLFKSMLLFSGWNIFGTFSNMMREQGLNMVLNLFFGPVVNAARGIAYQVSSGLQGFVLNISTAIRPQIVQSFAQGNHIRTINLMYSLSKTSICFLYIFAYPILLEIDFVLKIWLGVVPENTSIFVVIVVMISFINNMNAAVSAVVHASGEMKRYQLVGSTINLLSIPVAYYSLKLGFEASSVFFISFIFTIILQIASLIILKNIIKFSLSIYTKKVLIPFILVVLLSFIFPLIARNYISNETIRFIVVFIVGVLISGISFYIVGLNSKERNIINSFIIKKKIRY